MGDVRKLWIEGPAGRLEAALRGAGGARAAAVIAHPHPLHGGTLHNPVIFHTDRELNRAGLITLRFNFRGAGESDGDHDDGRGEVEDAAAAVNWLAGLTRELPLFFVGYSFGSVCGIRHAVENAGVDAVIALGLPVGRYDLDEARRLERPFAVVQASDDEFGSPEEVRRALDGAHPEPELHVVEGTSHLFPRRASDAALAVVAAAESLLRSLGTRRSS